MRRLVAIFLGSVLILAGPVILAYFALSADLPRTGDLISRASPGTTKIYDRHGRLLFEVLDPRAGRRTRVPLDELPLHLRQAVIAVEDRDFYGHPGIDLRGILRAVYLNLRAGHIVSGASTITQQLARDILLSPEEARSRSMVRKLRESILALRLTRSYGKDSILEMYLNEVYFGQLAYGAEAAAQVYFGIHARDLDLAQSALLAGLIQSPSAYNPLVDLESAKARQRIVLDLMVRNGFVTPEGASLARAEPLHFASYEIPIRAPHFVTYVRNQLEARYGAERVNGGGLRVVTTLDLDMQERAEAIVRRHLADLAERRTGQGTGVAIDHNVHNAALVALDPATGEILAMVGSPDYFDPQIDGAVNAALALRQPGSAIKPITYATAFGLPPTAEKAGLGGGTWTVGSEGALGPLTPATVLSDVETAFLTREGEPYRPRNYDRMWHGPISLRRALATSSNMIAVKVLDLVGVEAMIQTAEALGITTFGPGYNAGEERFGLALTLGGGEVKLLELTAAYAALANRGYRVDPIAILEVREEEPTGPGLASAVPSVPSIPSVPSVPAVSPQVAYLITDILSDDNARLPAFGENSVLKLSRPAAAKTGTTTDFRDNWTVGYTPDLAVGVWVGNADNTSMRHVTGITGAGPIWHAFMEEVLKGKPVRNFQRPDGVIEVEVCESSGLLATPYCPRRKWEVFIAGTEPTEYDDTYLPVQIDATTGLLWTPGCQGPMVEHVYRILPPEAKEWGRRNGIPEPPTEVCQPTTDSEQAAIRNSRFAIRDSQFALVITSPHPNSTFGLTSELPLAFQKIEVAARAGWGVSLREVTLLVDGEPLVIATRPPYRALWPLEAGQHVVTAVGVDSEGRLVESDVVRFWVEEAIIAARGGP